MKQSRVVILGGGTAGWLTAGIIASQLSASDQSSIEITLVESPDIKTIGVGEGTWPSMRTSLQKMGVSETEFIRQCDVSLKQGSRFDDWVTGNGDSYYHPYSLPSNYAEFNLANHWQAISDQVSFADAVCPQAALCANNLAPKSITTPEFAFHSNYGYHLDAAKFADFLQAHCTKKLGVRHVQGHADEIVSHQDGCIRAIKITHVTGESGEIEGELFIDCTGFASVLIGEHFGIESHSLSDVFHNDSALTLQVPHEDDTVPIASHTLSTAKRAGWIWDIALPSRRGLGYVYSNAHIRDDQAESELREYLTTFLDKDRIEAAMPRKISFTPAYKKKFWVKNCVAIGLSAGFVEPLEATAIALVEQSAKWIAEQYMGNDSVMPILAKRFNEKFESHWLQIIDFLKLHYVLSQRTDTEYWLLQSDVSLAPESLKESLEIWRLRAPWHCDTPTFDSLFPSASYQYVLYGMGIQGCTNKTALRAAQADTEKAHQIFSENIKRTQQMLNSMPSNREFINKVHTFGMQTI